MAHTSAAHVPNLECHAFFISYPGEQGQKSAAEVGKEFRIGKKFYDRANVKKTVISLFYIDALLDIIIQTIESTLFVVSNSKMFFFFF